jgi:alpha-D-ribose 1-methylphosphonate 5-triphosphate synthase subunit PhnI
MSWCLVKNRNNPTFLPFTSRPSTQGDVVKAVSLLRRRSFVAQPRTKSQAVSLNRMTVQRRVADVAKYVETQLSEIFSKCLLFTGCSLNEHDLSCATARMCLSARDVTRDFEVFEELVYLH